MKEATDKESVGAYVEKVLDGTGWQIAAVHRGGTRLEPPDWFWTRFAIDIYKEGEERELRLVAKGALNSDAWERLNVQMSVVTQLPCDPLNGIGYPRLIPETMAAYWFYPYDPKMPNLPLAADPQYMAPILLGLDPSLGLSGPIVDVERIRYLPEIGAILCYTIEVGGVPTRIFGKVQPGRRGMRAYDVVQQLWQAAARYPGYLNLPRPLGYVEELGLLLEEGIRGRPVSNRRTSTEFMLMADAAAEALAVIHEAGVETEQRIRINAEVDRLGRVVEQFAYVLPQGHFLLKDLVAHMREALRRTTEEEMLPTHGDLKYDQFMFHNDRFTLLDFDYYAQGETSYDLGKFCAYLVPSRPRSWRDSVAVEEARTRFIRRYRELRPQATLQRFGIYEGLQFALRAMAFMWAQAPGWQSYAESFLVHGYERLKSRLPD